MWRYQNSSGHIDNRESQTSSTAKQQLSANQTEPTNNKRVIDFTCRLTHRHIITCVHKVTLIEAANLKCIDILWRARERIFLFLFLFAFASVFVFFSTYTPFFALCSSDVPFTYIYILLRSYKQTNKHTYLSIYA